MENKSTMDDNQMIRPHDAIDMTEGKRKADFLKFSMAIRGRYLASVPATLV